MNYIVIAHKKKELGQTQILEAHGELLIPRSHHY